jgi:heavy metal sensor kinase
MAALRMRLRLTLWYAGVLGVALAVYSGATSLFLFRQLRRQTEHYAIQDIETVEGLLYFQPEGRLSMHEDYHNHPESKRVLERLVEVLAPDGAILYRNERLGSRTLGGSPFPGEGDGGYSARSGTLSDGTRIFLASRRHSIDGRPTLIRLAYSEEPVRDDIEQLLGISLLALPLTLVAAGFAGYGLARRALLPLKRMAEQAESISSERLGDRLPAGIDDEAGHLARVLNNTFSRLEHSFEQLRRFTSDASHELRTPLAAIRSTGEVALRRDASREEYRDAVGSMLEETGRLARIVDSLLSIARADAGSIQLHPSMFPLVELARESAALFEAVIEENRQRLSVRGDETIKVRADRLFLREAIVNVIHNAVKYAGVGGAIRIAVGRIDSNHAQVEIADSGPGIPPEHLSRIFDRFYRVDPARSSQEGAGLGLSIAKWAVQAHGGEILAESAEGSGCTFRIVIPCLAAIPELRSENLHELLGGKKSSPGQN